MDPKFAHGTKKAAPGPAAQDETRLVLDWFRRNGWTLAIAVVLAAAVYLGLMTRRIRQERLLLNAEQALQAARSTEHLRAVADDYAATPSGPPALLALAARHFHVGQITQAGAAYRQFRERYPEHFMRPAADVGLAFCLEAEDRWEEAVAAFKAFLRDHPDHFLRPQAELAIARCFEQLGRWDEAQAAYETVLAAGEQDGWAQRAPVPRTGAAPAARRRAGRSAPGAGSVFGR